MTNLHIDLLTDEEIICLKKATSFDLSTIYFDNSIELKGDWGIAYSDTCFCFKGQDLWLSIGQKTKNLNLQEYGRIAVFESEFPKDHPNSEISKIEYLPKTNEKIASHVQTLKNVFLYSVTEKLDDETVITYDCGLEFAFENNTSLFIYSLWNRPFAIQKSFNKTDFLENYSGETLSSLTARQIV